jgi:hypothetical protein
VTLDTWIAEAEREPVVFLPRMESHWAGMALGFASAALGAALARWELPAREALGWVALGGLLVGMLLHWKWKRAAAGWRIDFAQRRIEPVGQRGEAEAVSGDGWSIQTAPSDRKANIAIDLRHVDRGRVARLVDLPARRRAEMARISRLADALARRLNVERSGPRLDA